MSQIRIVIVEDDALMADCVRMELRRYGEFDRPDLFDTGPEFLKALPKYGQLPDLVLMDFNLPGMSGIEAGRQALEIFPRLKLVAFTSEIEEEKIVSAFRAGFRGYAWKCAPADDLVEALHIVHKGGYFIAPKIQDAVALYIFRREGFLASLSGRERHILSMIDQGLPQKRIAEELAIAPRTVEFHLANARKKLFAVTNAQTLHHLRKATAN